MMHFALAVPSQAYSIVVLAGLIAVLGAEIIVAQREKKLIPAKIKTTRTTP